MKFRLIILFCLFGFFQLYSQTYQRDGKGIKFIQLEGCVRTDNGNTCDSCFVITNGVNGKLNRCLHISQLRSLLLGGEGSADSTYLVDNEDGSYSLFNENGMEYQFGYLLDVSNNGDTLFLKDWDGHISNYILAADFDNQTLSWNPATKELGIANGNTVVLTGLGVDSVKLSLSGNVMTSKVNTLSDTSLVIGQNEIQLSGDVLYSTVNGVLDTANLSDLIGGNGIYGGSDTIPDSTLAFLPITNSFAIGSFPSWPSTNNSDLGIVWNGPYTGNQGLYFFGQQKTFPVLRYGFGKVTCDGISFEVNDPAIPTGSELNISDESWSLAEYNNATGYNSSIISAYGVSTWSSTANNKIVSDSINIQTYSQLAIDIAGLRGIDGQVLTAQGGYAVWADPCCDTMGAGGGVDSISLGISGNIMTMGVNALSDTSLIIGELNTNLSGNIITTEVNNVTDTSLVIGSNVLSWNGADKILTSTVNGVTDTSFVTGLNGIYSGSGNVPANTYAELLTNEEFAIGYFTDFGVSIYPNIDRGMYLKTNGTYIVGGDSTNAVRNSAEFLTGGTQIWSDSVSMESRIIVNKDSLVNRVMYVANNEGGRIGMWGDSMKLQQDYNNLIIQGPSITLNDHAGTGRGTSGQVWHSNGTSGYWDNVSGGATTNALSLSGNTMTSNVDGVIDTSLVIGELNTNLAGNTLTTEINNVTDTSLIIGSHVISWDSVNKTLTSNVNGISDTTKITIATGATSNTLSLSGNVITSNVDGVSDTSLVIGTNVLSYDQSTSILTSTINGVTDTTRITTGSIITHGAITSDQDDFNPTGFGEAKIIRISGDSGFRAITSMAAQTAGEEKTFINIGSYPIYFPGEHPDGTASNRIKVDKDLILLPKGVITFTYDDIESRWFVTQEPTIKANKSIIYYTVFGSATAGDYGEMVTATNNGAVSTVASSSTRPFGAMRLSTSTLSSASASVGQAKSLEDLFYLGTGHISTRVNVLFDNLSDGTNRYAYAHCIKDSIATAPNLYHGVTDPIGANVIAIVYSDTLNSGNWTGVCATTGGTTTTVDLGVTVNTNTVYDLQISVDNELSEVRYYINGDMVGRITTNIPSADGMGAQSWINKYVGTTARFAYVNGLISEIVIP